jgi:hypothetical protein
MREKIFITAYHQPKFGKLMGITVPEIIKHAVEETCKTIHVEPAAIDAGSIGATCSRSWHGQGLLAGLRLGPHGSETIA